MRIPLSKIYRAFPELDSFTDEQCKRFMKRIEVSGARRILPLLAFFLVTGVGLCASCVLFSLIYNIIDQAFPQFRAGRYQLLTNGIILVLTLGLPFLFGMIARDLFLRRHLRLVIGDKLNRIRCLQCRYLLIGQTVAQEAVTCPECGRMNQLRELGVVEADLIPPRTAGHHQGTEVK